MKSPNPLATLIISEEEGARELFKLRPHFETGDQNAGPAEIDQFPVRPRLQANGDIGAQLGLQPAATDDIRQARNAILLSLRLALTTGHEGIHYSRNRNDYTRVKHNNPDYWTFANMGAAVNSLLERPDLVRENRARPQNPYSPNFSHRRSVLCAGPDFVDALSGGPEAVSELVDQGERILLRDWRKKTQLIPPGPIVDETMRFLALFDGAVAGVHFSFSDPTIRWLSRSLAVGIVDGWKILINTERRQLTRIFTRTMFDGGRFYRVFWQELPKEIRRSLLIDGAPTTEYDYSACHLRLAYFAVGATLDMSGVTGPDHYSLDGFGPEWRTVIKRAVSILLNARTCHGAVGAIASVLPEAPWEQRIEKAVTLVSEIKKRHDALAPLWHSGCGLGLQFIDSRLTVACATELIDRGIVPLPIHDSMLVRAEHRGALVEVMDRHFEEDGPRLAAERFKGIAQRRARGFRGQNLTSGRPVEFGGSAVSAGGGSPFTSGANPLDRGSAISDLRLIDLTPLRCDPIVSDLESIVAHREWIPGGLIRSALLTAMRSYSSRDTAALAVRTWVAELVDHIEAKLEAGRLEFEVARFIKRKQRPITAQSIARLCGVTHTMAAILGLTVVIPPPRKTPASRRAKRMLSTLPRVINVEKAAPWGAEPRSSWYKRHPDPADRQVLALSTILASGDQNAIAAARAAVERAVGELTTLGISQALPADRLLARLQAALWTHVAVESWSSQRGADIIVDRGQAQSEIIVKFTRDTGSALQRQIGAYAASLSNAGFVVCSIAVDA